MKSYASLLLSLCTLLCLSYSVSAQQTLFGTVFDDIGDPVIGGTVKVLSGNSLVTGTATDLDGKYNLNLDPGIYNVEFSYTGFNSQMIQGVEILTQQDNKLDMNFINNRRVIMCTGCGVLDYKIPLIDISDPTQGMTIGSREIRRVSKPN